MMEYNPKDWHFLNMNSPADLYAEYQGNTVKLSEYDGCRDGHALVSRFAVEENMCFSTQIIELGQGIAIGLYYGDGCFSDYMLIVAQGNSIFVRVPNGVPQGDTFRRKGALRYYTIASIEYDCNRLSKLAFEIKNQRLYVYVDGVKCIDLVLKLPFKTYKLPKIMVKAVNETDIQRKSEGAFSGYNVKGIAKTSSLMITCVQKDEKTPWKQGSVHIAGEYEKWTRTNDLGEAFFAGLPFGKYCVVFGREGEEFTSAWINHKGVASKIIIAPKHNEQRENLPQENLQTDAHYIGLNGLWSFEINNDGLKRCIRVPFSWQSLSAFGEEELTDEYTLHQANSFFCTPKEIGEIGCYQRNISTSWEGDTELVFAAVSGVGKVYLDGKEMGCIIDSYNKHVFQLGKLDKGREYVLMVRVEYQHNNANQCNGKQGFWFTDAPGIWQNVWIKERYLEEITDIFVDYEIGKMGSVHIHVEAEIDLVGEIMDTSKGYQKGMYKVEFSYTTPFTTEVSLKIDGRVDSQPIEIDAVFGEGIFDKRKIYILLEDNAKTIEVISNILECKIMELKIEKVDITKQVCFSIEESSVQMIAPMEWDEARKIIVAKAEVTFQEWQAWSMKNPKLYRLSATVLGDAASHKVNRSVGIREVGTSPYVETLGTYITINGEKTYIRGVLDQGYNPWGIHTYPSLYTKEVGSATFDVLAAKECGYNLCRMHIKDNEIDWYRICDREGMLVWDELPCNFYGTSKDAQWQSMYKRQLKQAVRKHNYHPCVVLCSTINESWGISGDHEKSPWDDIFAQELIKEYASFYKKRNPKALLIDNSGYGKTSETQVLDYHSYPRDFEDAHQFFDKLSKMNFPGSVFNCYNEKNKILMQNEDVLDLLQRTCSQNLKTMDFKGNESQSGQPVLLSEFVHTDRQEELIRIFPKIAGYVRMNLASAENEDSSPYTSKRTKRDFGYVDNNFAPLTYQSVNAEDFLYMDMPFLSKVNAGERISIPVHLAVWSDKCGDGEYVEVCFTWKLFAENGNKTSIVLAEKVIGKISKHTVKKLGNIEVEIPKGYIGGYLFAKAYAVKEEIGVTSIQFEIFSNVVDNFVQSKIRTEWNTTQYELVDGFTYLGKEASADRNIAWAFGTGKITYHLPPTNYINGKLILEVSACDILEGTRITDEHDEDTEIEIFLNTRSIGKRNVKALTTDRKALFSNSSASDEKNVDYCKTGRFGYGSRIEIPITLQENEATKGLVLDIACTQRGMVLYGRRMGRYGNNPFIKWEN